MIASRAFDRNIVFGMEKKTSSAGKGGRRSDVAIVLTGVVEIPAAEEAEPQTTPTEGAESDSAPTGVAERDPIAVLNEDFDCIAATCEKLKGKILERSETGFLMSFRSPLLAVNYSLEIRKALADRHVDPESEPETESGIDDEVNHRVGIHVGEVAKSSKEVSGNALEIVTQTNSAAEPGGICLSQEAYQLVKEEPTLLPSIFEHGTVKTDQGAFRVHHILVDISRVEAAQAEASEARLEARREATARREAEEQAAAWAGLGKRGDRREGQGATGSDGCQDGPSPGRDGPQEGREEDSHRHSEGGKGSETEETELPIPHGILILGALGDDIDGLM